MDRLSNKRELKKLRQRDAGAIARWFRTYCDMLYTFVYYRVDKDANLASDIVQETFIGAIDKINDYDEQKGSMYAWLTYASKNHIRRALRARGRHLSYDQLWQQVDTSLLRCFEQIATEPLPDEVLQRKETAELVQMTLANIPANYRDVLNDYYYGRKVIKEIAALHGASEGAVRVLLYRARKAFREALLRLDKSFGPEIVKGGLNE